jgi:hypothetical protein
MAKSKRFPSPANPGKAPKEAAKAPAGPLPENQGSKREAQVQVEYKKENNHILGIGAHALAKGVNTIPAGVWAEAQKHPSVQKLMADGHLIDMSKVKDAPAEEDSDVSESEDDAEGEEAASPSAE